MTYSSFYFKRKIQIFIFDSCFPLFTCSQNTWPHSPFSSRKENLKMPRLKTCHLEKHQNLTPTPSDEDTMKMLPLALAPPLLLAPVLYDNVALLLTRWLLHLDNIDKYLVNLSTSSGTNNISLLYVFYLREQTIKNERKRAKLRTSKPWKDWLSL